MNSFMNRISCALMVLCQLLPTGVGRMPATKSGCASALSFVFRSETLSPRSSIGDAALSRFPRMALTMAVSPQLRVDMPMPDAEHAPADAALYERLDRGERCTIPSFRDLASLEALAR